jgi:hypothetical protein
MTKKTKARLSRGLIAALALILISWIVADSPSFKTCVHEAQQHSSDEPPKDKVSAFFSFLNIRKDCVGEFVENKGEAVLATFTVILAISTILLWLATKDLFEAGENQIRITQIAAEAASNGRWFESSPGSQQYQALLTFRGIRQKALCGHCVGKTVAALPDRRKARLCRGFPPVPGWPRGPGYPRPGRCAAANTACPHDTRKALRGRQMLGLIRRRPGRGRSPALWCWKPPAGLVRSSAARRTSR